MGNIYLETFNIQKSFGEVKALNDVNFRVNKGQIHGLLGENGAGKTCLMNIIYGFYQQDSGDIFINGQQVRFKNPRDAIENGIGMVHQLPTLVNEYTAIENIVLGSEGKKYSKPITKEIITNIEKLSEDYGLTFPLNAKVSALSAGIKQKVEIIRALYKEAKLLILDEPTTFLVESEFQQLLKSLRVLRDKGLTIILITHKIREVIDACQAITVLRKGKIQGALEKDEISEEKIVKLMFIEKNIEITKSALPKVKLPKQNISKSPICVFNNVTTKENKESPGIKNVNLEIYSGEIFGIASVSGNGEEDLIKCIINPQKITNGEIVFDGSSLNKFSTQEILNNGISITPEDRVFEGILQGASIKENLILSYQKDPRFCDKGIFINWKNVSSAAKKAITDNNVSAPHEDFEIQRLSGGNLQKVIMARAFLNPIKMLVTHNPTFGLDVSSVEFIFKKFVEIRGQGAAILWASEDLDELISLSDRIGVLYKGELKGIIERDNFDKYEIGLLMVGG